MALKKDAQSKFPYQGKKPFKGRKNTFSKNILFILVLL